MGAFLDWYDKNHDTLVVVARVWEAMGAVSPQVGVVGSNLRDVIHAIDADPAQFRKVRDELGDMSEKYGNCKKELDDELFGVERHWTGEAARTFAESYMPDLIEHVGDLAARCAKNKDVADEMAALISKTQTKVGKNLLEAAGLITGGGIVGTLTAPGLGTAIGAIIGEILAALNHYHNQVELRKMLDDAPGTTDIDDPMLFKKKRNACLDDVPSWR